MKTPETPNASPSIEMALIGPELFAKLETTVDKYRASNKREQREYFLGKKLSRFLFKGDHENKDQEGWPTEGIWDFALAANLWHLECEVEQGNIHQQATEELAQAANRDPRKMRELMLGAIFLHNATDNIAAPRNRKGLVNTERQRDVRSALTTLNTVFNAAENMKVQDAHSQETVFTEGQLYQSNGRVAYCLGEIEGEPYFEMPFKNNSGKTIFSIGLNTSHGIYLGKTLSGKAVFNLNEDLNTAELPQCVM